MIKIHSISVVNGYAFILYLKRNNNTLTVLESEVIALEELPLYIKNKRKLYLSIEQKFEYTENIQVPVAIANSRNVKNYLFYKIKEIHPNIEVLFNFKKLPKQNDEENITYNVEVLDEKSYLDALSFIDDFSKIKSVTTSKFALLSLANRCIDSDYYICVYTHATTVWVLAVEQKELIFSRSTEIESQNPETMQMDIGENITQTISYISNQFRDIEFKTLVLSGSIALDDVIPQHITMFNDLNISILYPNTFVENLNAEESQEHILSLGAVLVDKSNQFLPHSILGVRQFNILTSFIFVFSSLLVLFMLYFTFEEYEKYSNLVNQNEVLKQKYLNTRSQTKMLAEQKLQQYTNNIYMVKKYMKESPVDVLLVLKPLILLSQPSTFSFKNENGIGIFTIEFEKSFKELTNLYKFDKKFNEMKSKIKITKNVTIDYKKLLYKVQIKSFNDNTQTNKRKRRR